MALKTSFSIKGTVETVDVFEGGATRIRVLTPDGHRVDLWDEIKLGEASIATDVNGQPQTVDRNDGKGAQIVINQTLAGRALDGEVTVQPGDSVSGSISISASGASA